MEIALLGAMPACCRILGNFTDIETVEYNQGSEIHVSLYAPFRLPSMLATAPLIAMLMASFAAHGLTLGDAVARSALGSPLRVVIPITAAPGVALQPGCFRLTVVADDSSAPIVTARVSLERAASAARLVVTTPDSVNEPAIRLSVEAACDGSTRRVYVLLLDPPATSAFTAAAATQATLREPRQERLVWHPASAERSSGASAIAKTQLVHVPGLVERRPLSPEVVAGPSVPERIATAGAVISTAFHQVAGTAAVAAVAAVPPSTGPVAIGGNVPWPWMAAALLLVGAIALTALVVRLRRRRPEIPQWTRSPSVSGPRSRPNLAAAPTTRPHTLSHLGATTQARTASTPLLPTSPSSGSPLLGQTSTRSGRPSRALVDPSTIETLLDEVDPDVVEERALREAWAAARNDVERELDGNAILRAIEEAERELQLESPVQAHSGIESGLDDDLQQAQRRR